MSHHNMSHHDMSHIQWSSYSGNAECICRVGYFPMGDMCLDINECQSNPCNSGATCINMVGGFKCEKNPDVGLLPQQRTTKVNHYYNSGRVCQLPEVQNRKCGLNSEYDDVKGGSGGDMGQRIVNGKETNTGIWPWIAYLIIHKSYVYILCKYICKYIHVCK